MQKQKEFVSVREAIHFLQQFGNKFKGNVIVSIFDLKCEDCKKWLRKIVVTLKCENCNMLFMKGETECQKCKGPLKPVGYNWYCKDCEIVYDKHKMRWI